jgi:hypothetical protein
MEVGAERPRSGFGVDADQAMTLIMFSIMTEIMLPIYLLSFPFPSNQTPWD